jgi:hypothetical protein
MEGGEGTCLLLNLDLSLSQRENQVKEGEGARLPLYLDHSPSCSSSTEIPAHPLSQRENQVKEGEGARLPLYLDLPLSQRENQVEEGEGTYLLLNLDHPPVSNTGKQLAKVWPVMRWCPWTWYP